MPNQPEPAVTIAQPAVHPHRRKPDWLKVQLNTNDNYAFVAGQVAEGRLTTVCEEAKCPNIHECWGHHKTATFMVLGDTCTRRCRFCAVKTGKPQPVDWDEPRRVAAAVTAMQLRHVVITMVNRDELADGGAALLAATVRAVQEAVPTVSVEVLSSDLMGERRSIATVVAAAPHIISHNIETVRRLTPRVRSRSTYERSLAFLATAREIDPEITVKSSLMVGLGETADEILETLRDLRAVGTQIVNIGQYLQPTRAHVAVERYWTPDEFDDLRRQALALGFDQCAAGPLVRSSYHAAEQFRDRRRAIHPLYRDEHGEA